MTGPAPRPPLSDRVESPDKDYLLSGQIGAGSANETGALPAGSVKPGRITAARVERIRARLTPADWELIGHLQAAKVLTGRQLRSILQASSVSAQRMLRRQLQGLETERVLARLGRRIGGVRAGSDSYVWALDVVGQRLVTAEAKPRWRRPWTPSARILAHALAVSDLYVTLLEAQRHGQIEVLGFDVEPACWRSYIGRGGARSVLKPDALVVVARADLEVHAWIEMDMATESLPWITDKARAYGRYFDTGKEQTSTGVFPRCLWLTPTRDRALHLVDALGQLPPEQWRLHQVAPQARAVAALLAGAERDTHAERGRP